MIHIIHITVLLIAIVAYAHGRLTISPKNPLCFWGLETNMTREYGELRSELGKVKEVVTNISSQVDTESQAVPQRPHNQVVPKRRRGV